jgi:hypothetical protein
VSDVQRECDMLECSNNATSRAFGPVPLWLSAEHGGEDSEDSVWNAAVEAAAKEGGAACFDQRTACLVRDAIRALRREAK